MLSLFVDTAHAMGTSPQSGEAPNPLINLLPIVLMFVIFYFLLIRPQQKRAKEHKAMLESVQRGDEVVTSGGILGKVTALGDEYITIEIAENVKVRLQRQAIMTVKKGGGNA